MSTRQFMLDTNIVSDLLRNPAGSVSKHVRALKADAICISIVTAAELRFGAAKRGAKHLTNLVEGLLKEIDVAPIDPPFDRDYAAIRVALERRGRLIGPNDLMIAAHARSLGAVLVTNNEREFTRVPNLAVENWLT